MTYTRRSSVRRRVAVAVGVLALLISAQARAAGPTITFETDEGLPASGAWGGGGPRFNVAAEGPRGVRSIRVLIDGQPRKEEVFRCYYEYPHVQPPCDRFHAVGFVLPTTDYGDGAHSATVEAVDSDGVTSTASVPLRFDNTPPAPPTNPLIDGGVGWRSQPQWRISWTNPTQQFAPLGGVRYKLCPAEADSSDATVAANAKTACVYGEYAAPDLRASWVGPALIDSWIPASRRHDLTRLPEPFRLPKPGLWTLRVWLVDAAISTHANPEVDLVPGNSNPEAPMVIPGLGYDPTPPQVAGFAVQDPNDPARVFVGASEDVSPLAGGSIEAQRRGSKLWRPLATEVRSDGITAFVDDETLRRGRYRLRAIVTNAAGLQQGTDRGTDGQIKTLRLPIRAPSRLQAGRRVGKVCHGLGHRRRCRWRLARRVTVRLGRRITLRARLTVGRRPVKHQPLELWQRETVAGAKWQRIGSVQTNGHGRLRYKARKGVARKLRFRYPGTPQIRGDNGTVALHVQAKTTLSVSRRRVINGEYVTFRGRLKGNRRPPSGLLVELQVRSRGKWRTFAQPRTDAAGAWQYQYRFETVSTSARFRFRARVRQQVGYPFATGSSRTLGVRVRGL